MRWILLTWMGLGLLLPGGRVQAEDYVLGEYFVGVSDAGALSISDGDSGSRILTSGLLHAPGTETRLEKGTLRIVFRNNDQLEIAPRARARFLQLTWTLAGGREGRTLGNLELLSFRPAQAAGGGSRFLGTAGLFSPGEGSYLFLASGDPESRRGWVAAWLTSERGSGVFLTSRIDDGESTSTRVTARLDYGRHPLGPGDTETTDRLLFGAFDDVRLGLEAYADEVRKHYAIELPPQPGVYCTWYHARASSESLFGENLRFVERELRPYGLDVLQIDDGWQLGVKGNGPRRNFTAHDPKGPYPSGMKPTADKTRAAGLVPGIWWMPFAGTDNDPHYADRQDLFVHEDDGSPRNVRWGGTCLDMTHPEALEYVEENARRIAQDWSYGYFKLDGLWTGIAPDILYVNTGFREDHYGLQKRHDPRVPPVLAYRRGMQAVRRGAGGDVFILGCNLAQNLRTLGASYGLFDAMRVGPDNNARNWGSLVRGVFNSGNRYFLHGRVWYNDPDPHYVRPVVPLEQARALSSWVAVTGFLNTTSEQYDTLPPERLDLFRRTLPAHRFHTRPVDYLETSTPTMWLATDPTTSPKRHLLGLFNWTVERKESDGALKIDRPLERCDLLQGTTYVGFDYWGNSFLPEVRERIRVTLPYNECRIWALREKVDHPLVVSTSRHVAQGLVDILEETWDPASRTLRGRSQVVGGDPYELRVWLPEGFAPQGVEVETSEEASSGSARAPVTLERRPGEPGVRVRIEPTTTVRLGWRIRF